MTYVASPVMLCVFNSSNSYLKVKYPYNSYYFCLDFIFWLCYIWTLSLFLWSVSHFYYDLLWPFQAMCVMHYRTSNHLRYKALWYEALWKMQARSLDPVTHPRAFQPLDQNIGVWRKDNYYVARISYGFCKLEVTCWNSCRNIIPQAQPKFPYQFVRLGPLAT